jgi:HEAT repeat protein
MVTALGQASADGPVFDRVKTVLIERLGDADPSVRLAAIHGLGSLAPLIADGPPPALVAALNDESDRNREAVFLALGSNARGLTPLLPSLVRSWDEGPRRSQAAMLKLLENVRPPRFPREAIPGLLAALSSRVPELTRVAAASISAFKEAAGPAVPDVARTLDRFVTKRSGAPGAADDPPTDVLIALADCLQNLSRHTRSQDEAVTALAKLLRPEFDSRARVAAATALGRFRPSPLLYTALTERIDDHDRAVRVAVMWAFDHADFGTGYRVPKALAAALEDQSAEVRGAAAAALGHSGVGLDPFIPALLRHAQGDVDSEVKAICVSVLDICTGPPKVSPAIISDLIQALRTPSAQIREAVCSILFRFGRAAVSAVPAIVTALNDADVKDAHRYRWIAAQALGKIAPGTPGAERAIVALIRSLEYQDRRGRTASVRALAEFGPAAAAAIPRLERLQEQNEPDVTEAAAEALGKITRTHSS